MKHFKMEQLTLFVLLATLLSFTTSCGDHAKRNNGNEEVTEKTEIQLLNDAVIANSKQADPYVARATFYLENAEIERAYEDAMTAILNDSTSGDAYQILAEIYMVSENMTNAEEAISKAIALDPKNPEYLLKAAKFYLVIENYDLTKAYAKRCLDVDRDQSDAYYLLAYAYLEDGDTLKAIRNFERTLDVDQRFFEAYIQLGMIYASKSDPIAANYYEAALKIRPNNLELMYLIGYYYQETVGDFPRAMRSYDKILLADSSYINAWFNKGYINLVYFHKYNRAIRIFDKVLELNPDSDVAWYNRGLANEQLENFGDAKRDYDRGLMINPYSDQIIEGLKRINALTPKIEK